MSILRLESFSGQKKQNNNKNKNKCKNKIKSNRNRQNKYKQNTYICMHTEAKLNKRLNTQSIYVHTHTVSKKHTRI